MTLSTIEVRSPRGRPLTLLHREGTSDLGHIGSSFHLWAGYNDEYGLEHTTITGVALDIGAHMGSVSAAILVDNPDARVIALEPIPENCEVIAETAALNGWADRITILQGGLGCTPIVPVTYGYDGSEYGRTNRFVGNLSQQTHEEPHISIEATGYTVAQLIDMAGGTVEIAKFDCEGCEWDGLAEPEVVTVPLIVGEYHGDPGPDAIRTYLSDTHRLTIVPNGACGLFRAVAR